MQYKSGWPRLDHKSGWPRLDSLDWIASIGKKDNRFAFLCDSSSVWVFNFLKVDIKVSEFGFLDGGGQ